MDIITYSKEDGLTFLQIDLIKKLNADIESILTLTINELAAKLNVDTSTLSRLVKKLGFDNYNAFKLKVAVKYKTFKDYNLQPNNNPTNIVNNTFKLYSYAINGTFQNVEPTIIEKAAEQINSAHKILIWSQADYRIICENLYTQLSLLKYDVTFLNNFFANLQLINLMNKGDVLILLSRTMHSLEHNFLIELAHRKELNIILITANKEYKKVTNMTKILTENIEINNYFVDNPSYTPSLLIINMLIGIIIHKYHPLHYENRLLYAQTLEEWKHYRQKK